MQSHFLHMLLLSLVVSMYFAVLLRRDLRAQFKLGGILLAAMVGGTLLLAGVMFPFPR